ncbi:unnamed protein product [Owenia fusiformis]|uniref:Uncharacterized protein n=1 Tax=Owenia fusiformis TaxID=6347 RepID=A0A8J1TRJ1_OWEFU|nr:unnamed protein product [Owenia fusiformis]
MSLLYNLLRTIINIPGWLCVLLLGAFTWTIWRYIHPWGSSHLPPGRAPWPLLGNISLRLNKTNERRLWETSIDLRSYTISQWLGPMYMIVLHRYEDIKEAFSKDEFSGRNESLFKGPLNKYVFSGLFNVEGPRWEEQRKFTITTLKEFGLGRNRIEQTIQKEFLELSKEIAKHNGEAFDMKHLLNTCVSNIICSMVFGHRFNYTDKTFQRMMNLMGENTVNFRRAIIGSMIPGSRFIPGDPFCIKKLKANIDEIRRMVIVPELKAHMENYDPNSVNDYIDAFIKQMRKPQSEETETWFTEDQLQWNIEDLFAAGTETTATSLRWVFLCMLHYPDVQTKVRSEIHRVVGKERLPSMHDKVNMPYTEATLVEIQRACTVTSLGPPHCSFHEPTKFQDYILPPRTNIFANFYAVNNDPDYWKDPEKFRPERFIGEDGKFKKDDHVMTFSVGKRSCIGESLAKMELFLFFTCVLQRYKVVQPEGVALPSMDRVPGIAIGPKPYKLRLIKD